MCAATKPQLLLGLVDYADQTTVDELVAAAERSRDELIAPYRIPVDRVVSVKLRFRQRCGEPVDLSDWLLRDADGGELQTGVLLVRAVGKGALDVVRQHAVDRPYHFVTCTANGAKSLLRHIPISAIHRAELVKLLATRNSLLSVRIRGFDVQKMDLPSPDDLEEFTETASMCRSDDESDAEDVMAVSEEPVADDDKPVSLRHVLRNFNLLVSSEDWWLRNGHLGRRLIEMMQLCDPASAWLVIELTHGGVLDSVSAVYLSAAVCQSSRLVIELRHTVVSSMPLIVLCPVSATHTNPVGVQLHSDEGYYHSAAAKYTYAGDCSVRGVVFAGSQNDVELVTYAHALDAYAGHQTAVEMYEAMERGNGTASDAIAGDEAFMPVSIPDFWLPSHTSSPNQSPLMPPIPADANVDASSGPSIVVVSSRRKRPCGCVVTEQVDHTDNSRVRQIERCAKCSDAALRQHHLVYVPSIEERRREHFAAVMAIPTNEQARVPIRVAVRKYCEAVPGYSESIARHHIMGSKLIYSLLDVGRSKLGRYYVDLGRVRALDFTLLPE